MNVQQLKNYLISNSEVLKLAKDYVSEEELVDIAKIILFNFNKTKWKIAKKYNSLVKNDSKILWTIKEYLEDIKNWELEVDEETINTNLFNYLLTYFNNLLNIEIQKNMLKAINKIEEEISSNYWVFNITNENDNEKENNEENNEEVIEENNDNTELDKNNDNKE